MLDQMLVFTQVQLLSRQDRGWADGQTVKADNCCPSIILRLNVLNVLFFFNEKEILLHLADETGRTTICLVTIQMFFFFFSRFLSFIFFEKLLLK